MLDLTPICLNFRKFDPRGALNYGVRNRMKSMRQENNLSFQMELDLLKNSKLFKKVLINFS